MNIKGRKSISYGRFSSGQQSSGDSVKRQQETYNRIVSDFELVDVGSFFDSGKSGFKGEHKRGELGQLIEMLENQWTKQYGDVRPIIVIERWDRIGRLSMDDTIDLFRRLVKHADILDASDRQLYGSGSLNNIADYMTIGIKAYQAHVYSKNLSERVRSAKRNQALNASKTIIKGRNHPHWLRISNDRFELIQSRAETIQTIYRLKLCGMGIRSIANYLNENKFESWDNRGNTTDPKWLAGTVRNHLKNIAVCGVFKNRDVEVKGYYPTIVSYDDYQRVQSTFTKQVQREYGTNKRDGSNILVNVKCGYCGESMQFAKRENDKSILACCMGKQCENSSIRYRIVEHAVLSLLFEESNIISEHISNSVGEFDQDKQQELDDLQSELNTLREYANKQKQNGKRVNSAILIQMDEIESEIDDIKQKQVRETVDEISKPYWDMMTELEDRLLLGRYIKRFVDRVEVFSIDRKRKHIVLDTVDGNRYQMVVKTKPGDYELCPIKGVMQGEPLVK
ncbi:recombinase family protein [Shewanella sp. SE1]|uniref:recombinase family protein n=1 Tax=Shewanella sp. SE1 TaxID=2705014 RepID=UPI00138F5603|nr:recombinase family protein [Shewanella sp. SE1]NDO73050.1 recombinase family protein [Shewanella sp. SE1]